MRPGLLLVAVAVVAPSVAYAASDAVKPADASALAAGPATLFHFSPGQDYAVAERSGFAGAFLPPTGGPAYTLLLSGLSGGTLVVDDLVDLRVDPRVESFHFQVASPLRGTLTPPDVLKLRLWTGAVPPDADDAPGVCATLDLTAPALTESDGACASSVRLQFLYALPDEASGTSVVTLRPSSVQRR